MCRYDEDVRLHAVKVIANLAADSHNQVRIVEEGGVQALLDILGCGGENNGEATCRIAAGALANLAMREATQLLILDSGAVELLALFAHNALEPQSHRMVAGAVANLCGNNQVEAKLHATGGLELLVALSESDSPDVLAQVGRGFANYSRCDAGRRRMVREGALPRVVALANQDSLPGANSAARRHAQVALCEMAMDAKNAPTVVDQPGAAAVLEYIAEQTSGGSNLRKAAIKALGVIGRQAAGGGGCADDASRRRGEGT